MNKKKQVILVVVLTFIGIMFINEFAFGLFWDCRCFDEMNALSRCDTFCGYSPCEGVNPVYTWGVCIDWYCLMEYKWVCADGNNGTAVYDGLCGDCIGGW